MQSAYTKEIKKFFKGPAGQLEAQVCEQQGLATAKQLAIICHPHPLHQGTMENKVVTTVTKSWQQLGFATVRFNFRGVGESEGSYDHGNGEIEDLKAVLSDLQTINSSAQLWLAGFSFGSFIAFQVAQQACFPIQALLSIAPPIHHFDFSLHQPPTCPWFILQGELDTLVPFQKVQHWFQAIQSHKPDAQLFSFAKADHFFHGNLIELKEVVQMITKPLLSIT